VQPLDEALRTCSAAEEAHAGIPAPVEGAPTPDPNVIMNSALRQKELVEHLAYTANCWGVCQARRAAAALRHIHDDLVNVKEMIRHMQASTPRTASC